MIGICTDSSSQVPPDSSQRYGIEVVPLHRHRRRRRLPRGRRPRCRRVLRAVHQRTAVRRSRTSRAQPGPVRRRLRGPRRPRLHRDPLASTSPRRVAAPSTPPAWPRTPPPMPVRVVDSGTAGFGVSCCVWAAAEAIARRRCARPGGTVAERLRRRHRQRVHRRCADTLRRRPRIDSRRAVGSGDAATLGRTVCDCDVLDAVNAMASRALGLGRPAARRDRAQ